MIVYKDIFTGKTIFTDAYKFTEVDNLYYLVEGEIVELSSGIDSDAMGGSVGDGGGEVIFGANIVRDFSLEGAAKASNLAGFRAEIKAYSYKLLGQVKQHNPTEVEAFQSSMSRLCSDLVTNFDNYSFLTTEDDGYDGEGMIIPYQQESPRGEEKAGDSCKIIVFKAGVHQESS